MECELYYLFYAFFLILVKYRPWKCQACGFLRESYSCRYILNLVAVLYMIQMKSVWYVYINIYAVINSCIYIVQTRLLAVPFSYGAGCHTVATWAKFFISWWQLCDICQSKHTKFGISICQAHCWFFDKLWQLSLSQSLHFDWPDAMEAIRKLSKRCHKVVRN